MEFDCCFRSLASTGKSLLELVVGWAPALELEQVDDVLLVFGSPLVAQAGHEAVVEGVVGLAAVEVAEGDDLLQVNVHLGLAQSVVLGIRSQSIQLPLHIVANDVQLVETGEECLGGGNIGHIAQTEHILELPVLQSMMVDIELTSAVSQTSLGQNRISLGFQERVEGAVGSFDGLASFHVLEHGSLALLLDFNQLESVLHIDVPLLALLPDELVSAGVVVAEGVVGIDDREPGVGPADPAGLCSAVPQGLGQ